MSEVTLRNLTKIYGDNTVVDHINLTVADGTLTSILGPSGCGKTTTLRMIAGFEAPQDGEILFDGEPVGAIPVNRRDIGMVFQSYALFPHMTVYQNVAYGLEQRKIRDPELKQRVMDALDMVHMAEYANRKPKQLSGGQQQRVALARALVIRPRVLLLDECLSALDKKLRVEMQTELRRILEECRVTTFFVTHDQEEAMTLSDSIVVMNNGVIEQTGSPFAVYETPRNRFVAGFLGKANFFEGVVEAVAGGRLTLSGLELPASGAQVGERVCYAVRPEKITLSAGGDGLRGVVENTVYTGNAMLVTVRCGSRELLVESRGVLDVPCARGGAVVLTWPPEAAVRLEEGPWSC